MSAPRHSFGKEKHLRKKREIDALFANGAPRVSFSGLTARYAKNGLMNSRIAIANGRRWGCAPERNRVRRIAREVFRVWVSVPRDTQGCVDIVVTQYAALRGVSGSEIAHRVRRLFDQIK
ncbi:MAG: ribonuclease P protein component [Spirochaetota bacterium]|jgi:ribonuclease P protein component|nr:ribonuclease P protein component [Spirochaetota bacterium]